LAPVATRNAPQLTKFLARAVLPQTVAALLAGVFAGGERQAPSRETPSPGLSSRRHMSRFRPSPWRSIIRYHQLMRACASLHAQGELWSSDGAEALRPTLALSQPRGPTMRPTHNTLSATLGDADTADLFTEISRGVDHQLWLVESHAAPI
jgi:hypothetical protein